jgi:Lrp/AsnC family transcriptional regulator for asnA, asnC and gidA
MPMLDPIDRKIIALLRADARRPNTDIARRVGLTEGAVRRRLERLLAEDVIRPTVHLNPSQAGLLHAIIGIDIDLRRLDEVAARIATLPEVTYAVLSTGPRDMILMVMVRSQEHLLAFIRDKLVQVPGVRDCQTSVTLKTIKLAYDEQALEADEPPIGQEATA